MWTDFEMEFDLVFLLLWGFFASTLKKKKLYREALVINIGALYIVFKKKKK